MPRPYLAHDPYRVAPANVPTFRGEKMFKAKYAEEPLRSPEEHCVNIEIHQGLRLPH